MRRHDRRSFRLPLARFFPALPAGRDRIRTGLERIPVHRAGFEVGVGGVEVRRPYHLRTGRRLLLRGGVAPEERGPDRAGGELAPVLAETQAGTGVLRDAKARRQRPAKQRDLRPEVGGDLAVDGRERVAESGKVRPLQVQHSGVGPAVSVRVAQHLHPERNPPAVQLAGDRGHVRDGSPGGEVPVEPNQRGRCVPGVVLVAVPDGAVKPRDQAPHLLRHPDAAVVPGRRLAAPDSQSVGPHPEGDVVLADREPAVRLLADNLPSWLPAPPAVVCRREGTDVVSLGQEVGRCPGRCRPGVEPGIQVPFQRREEHRVGSRRGRLGTRRGRSGELPGLVAEAIGRRGKDLDRREDGEEVGMHRAHGEARKVCGMP